MKIIVKDLLNLAGEIQENINRAIEVSLPEIAELLASSFEENFMMGGRWDGNGNVITLGSGGTQKWKPLAQSTKDAYKRQGYSQQRTLNRTAGGLASAIEVRPEGRDSVLTSAKKKYARIQQLGGTIEPVIPITEKMRSFFWARFYETEDEKYKAMALTKKTEFRPKIKIPASPYLVIQLQDIEDISEVIARNL